LIKLHGAQSTTAKTVRNMLEMLERTADELKIKRWNDIKVTDVELCLRKIQKFSPEDLSNSQRIKSLDEIEDDMVVVSGQLTTIISGLTSKQVSQQREALCLLQPCLVDGKLFSLFCFKIMFFFLYLNL
jgi:hypothetical protein